MKKNDYGLLIMDYLNCGFWIADCGLKSSILFQSTIDDRRSTIQTVRNPQFAVRNSLSGFTLVELLVTLCLMVLIMGVVMATFAGGIRVWERLEAPGTSPLWIQIAFHELRQDFRNARRFEPLAFEGRRDSLSFPALILTDTESGSIYEMGQMDYYFDSNRHILCRSERPYRTLRRSRMRDDCSPLLMEVDQVRFTYYGDTDVQTGKGSWKGRWSSPHSPRAVKMEIRSQDPQTHKGHVYEMLVTTPITLQAAP